LGEEGARVLGDELLRRTEIDQVLIAAALGGSVGYSQLQSVTVWMTERGRPGQSSVISSVPECRDRAALGHLGGSRATASREDR
jgi:hypothetical protein